MPKYFFNVYNGSDEPHFDEAGEELPDRSAAWHEATAVDEQLEEVGLGLQLDVLDPTYESLERVPPARRKQECGSDACGLCRLVGRHDRGRLGGAYRRRGRDRRPDRRGGRRHGWGRVRCEPVQGNLVKADVDPHIGVPGDECRRVLWGFDHA